MSDTKIIHTTEDGGIMFFCPGCKCGHKVWVLEPSPSGSRWTWNNNFEKPTISPSILVTCDAPAGKDEHGIERPAEQLSRCHSHVIDGVIQFCSDCSHELAGKNLPLEAF